MRKGTDFFNFTFFDEFEILFQNKKLTENQRVYIVNKIS